MTDWSNAQDYFRNELSSPPSHPSTPHHPFDVLCGKDKETRDHSGNMNFRTMVQEYREVYQNAARGKKYEITCEFAAIIAKQGGRFLKFDANQNRWVPAEKDMVKEKISHALRSAKDPHRDRTRKKRKVVEKVYSDKEKSNLAALLRKQRSILERFKEEQQIPEINAIEPQK
jgi:hypothetical protein